MSDTEETYEVIPVAAFEAVCPDCHLVYPKASGCESFHGTPVGRHLTLAAA